MNCKIWKTANVHITFFTVWCVLSPYSNQTLVRQLTGDFAATKTSLCNVVHEYGINIFGWIILYKYSKLTLGWNILNATHFIIYNFNMHWHNFVAFLCVIAPLVHFWHLYLLTILKLELKESFPNVIETWKICDHAALEQSAKWHLFWASITLTPH